MRTPLEVSRLARVPVSLLTLGALVGCRAAAPGSPGGVGTTPAPVERFDAGRSGEDRPIEAISIGRGREVVLYIAAMHGSENAGTPLLERLAGNLAQDPDLLHGRRVVVVPIANPDGLALGSRGNAAAVDLSRDFPARNPAADGAAPQPETQALIDLIKDVRPTRIVTLHQPLGCIDYDGPARDLAQALGSLGVLNVRKLGARAGSLGAWAGTERGIPVITLELPGGAERHGADQLWLRYGSLLLKAVSYR